MAEKLFLDAGFFIYAQSRLSLSGACAAVKEAAEKFDLCSAELCLFEFYRKKTGALKSNRLSREEAFSVIRAFRGMKEIDYLKTGLFDALEDAAAHMPGNDGFHEAGAYEACIASILKKERVTRVVTAEPERFAEYPWISAVAPHEILGAAGRARPDGGACFGYIPYGRQSINENDIDCVCSVLRSDFITQGPRIPEFERSLAEKVGAAHAVAVNSATSALHIACRALGVGVGDLVWTSPITFVASANCALYCGARVDFVDIDPHTYNMSITALAAKLEKAKSSGALPKLLIPVHMCGQSCEMEEIGRLADEFGFSVIEDASHAVGGCYKEMPVGNCRYSDITVFSFHPVKIITTAEGGTAVTNKKELFDKMALLRSHGISRKISPDGVCRAGGMEAPAQGGWRTAPDYYYEQYGLGYNYRMTDLHAALGLSQLERLDAFVAKRRELAENYDRMLQAFPLVTPLQSPHSYSAYHLYPVRLKLAQIKKTRREVFESLKSQGVGVNVHYIPVHLQPFYRNMGFAPGDFPEAEKYYAEAITLPLFPEMTMDEQKYICEALRKSLYDGP